MRGREEEQHHPQHRKGHAKVTMGVIFWRSGQRTNLFTDRAGGEFLTPIYLIELHWIFC